MWHVASRRQRGPAQRRPCRQTQAYLTANNTTSKGLARIPSKRRKMSAIRAWLLFTKTQPRTQDAHLKYAARRAELRREARARDRQTAAAFQNEAEESDESEDE